ncbi:MAG TPA: hypothetical protein PLY40_06210, partial [Bacillota bacterium]|nr:hypothetical protein [Bacillota bacterium]
CFQGFKDAVPRQLQVKVHVRSPLFNRPLSLILLRAPFENKKFSIIFPGKSRKIGCAVEIYESKTAGQGHSGYRKCR